MSKQTAVEKLEEFLREHCNPCVCDIEYSDFNIALAEAKQKEKEQKIDAIKTEIKLIGNYFDVGKLEQREQAHHIRFTNILKDRFDYYNKIYGGQDESK